MDVERTMEFILQMQAKSGERMARYDQMQAKSEERMAKYDERMAKSEERMAKFDKRLEATRKIVEIGMKLMVRLDKKQIELRDEVKALAQQHRKTERTLDRFIASLTNRRSN